VALLAARDLRQPLDADDLAHEIRTSVNNVVQCQVGSGLDVINDGEHSKTSFSSYVAARLGGLTPLHEQSGFRGESRDTLQFPACDGPVELRDSSLSRQDITPSRRRWIGQTTSPCGTSSM
jgi:methionine synthase II (cobalamin-independent)